MDEAAIEEAKRRAAEAAVEAVSDGDVVGLGTGSTAAFAVRELGRRVDAGLDVRGIPTSYQAGALAREVDIPVVALADATPDVAIDGADQVARSESADSGVADLVKGGGAAHAREKVVGGAADRFLVVVDERKVAEALDAAVPVEVLPDAEPTVGAAIEDHGGDPTLRDAAGKDGPVVTDNGNLVLDAAFGSITDPADLAADLAGIPGVVAHGLFVGTADAVYVGTEDGVRTWTP